MNKTELIDKIAVKAGLTKADSKKALEATLEAIKEALAANDKVALIGFGTFSVSVRAAREGINPVRRRRSRFQKRRLQISRLVPIWPTLLLKM